MGQRRTQQPCFAIVRRGGVKGRGAGARARTDPIAGARQDAGRKEGGSGVGEKAAVSGHCGRCGWPPPARPPALETQRERTEIAATTQRERPNRINQRRTCYLSPPPLLLPSPSAHLCPGPAHTLIWPLVFLWPFQPRCPSSPLLPHRWSARVLMTDGKRCGVPGILHRDAGKRGSNFRNRLVCNHCVALLSPVVRSDGCGWGGVP